MDVIMTYYIIITLIIIKFLLLIECDKKCLSCDLGTKDTCLTCNVGDHR